MIQTELSEGAGRLGERDGRQPDPVTLQKVWADYDFFFPHYKYTDSTGETGKFPAKVEMIERFDAAIPAVRALKPDVLIVTGDHSTPSKIKSHSWHPVPVLL
jgi:2,3-bisphosphoglycerate-independent phosphoglycerate mutase